MNTPRLNADDPKWTAYVLGELDDVERAEIDHLLESSGEARALVEELQVATAALKDELMPSSFGLLPEQRAAIRTAAAPVSRPWFNILPPKWAWGLGAAAASLTLMAVSLPFLVTDRQVTPQIAEYPAVQNDTSGVPTTAREAKEDTEKRIQSTEPETVQVAQAKLEKSNGPAAASVAEPVISFDEFNQLRDGVQSIRQQVDPKSALTATAVGAIGNLPEKEQDLAAYLSELARQNAASPGNPNIVVDGFNGGALPSRQEITDTRTVNQSFSAAPPPPPPAPAPPPPPPPAATVTRDGLAVAGGRAGGGGGGGRGAGPAIGQGQGGGVGAGVAGGVLGGVFSAAPVAAPPPPPPSEARTRADLDRVARPSIGTEAYDRIIDNPFIRTSQENFATLSIDVDTASYSNVRRFLMQNQLPPRDAVRIEELLNYFSYDYAQPTGQAPIAPNLEVASAPWNPQHRLVRVGIKAREVNRNQRPPSNLVFLVDVSGSMNEPNKLPLVKSGLQMLTNNLSENDFVSMVVYAGASGLVLPPTSGARKDVIHRAIDSLQAGGSTNGGAGIQLAYNQATANFIRNGVNRVILMTDGDFNVGITNQGDLTRLIEQRAKSGVFLSVLGFGTGNLKDSTMEKLADTGNGHYAYIDTINEARKVLVEEMGGTLVTVAKDVKIQIDFNPNRVEAYRLIGYENRLLRTEDFNNDLKDAGDMGAGHTVTALFEIVPKGGSVPGPSIDPSRYQTESVSVAPRGAAAASASDEMLTLRVRYKLPEANDSTRMDFPLTDRGTEFSRASQDFRFAASVASFGMILRDSPYKGNASLNTVLDLATSSRGQDRSGYREEFLSLVRRANNLR